VRFGLRFKLIFFLLFLAALFFLLGTLGDNSRSMFFFLGALALFTAGIGLWFSYRISCPVKSLTTAIERLKAGDFSVRVSFPGPDEFLLLGQALNQLAEQLERGFSQSREQRVVQNTTLETLSEGVLATDRDGKVVFANSALRSMFRLERDLTGQSFHSFFRQPTLVTAFEKGLKKGGSQKVSIKQTFPTHKVFDVYFSVPQEAQSVRLVAVFQDVTQTYRLEQVRKDFVANASHELRTPLSVIKGYAETLEDGLVAESEKKQVFQTLNENIRRMGSLIDDLLHLSKLESPEFTLRPEKLLVLDVAQAVAANLKPKADAKRQSLAVVVRPDLSLTADREELKVALKNLLENAIHYTGPGGKISVQAAQRNGIVEITVADTGIGIPSQELGRIFERFYRVDKSRAREEGGTGLGLSIVKHIAEAHGGRVEVESEVGKGSHFTLVIPS